MIDFSNYQQLSTQKWWEWIITQNIQEIGPLLFDIEGEIYRNFKSNVEILMSPSTLTPEDVHNMELKHFQCVAQSTDGDYLFTNDTQTLIIPVDLHKTDIESFPMNIAQFMAQWQKEQIHSKYLRK